MLLRVGVVAIEEVLPYVQMQGKPPHGHPDWHPGRPFRMYHGFKIFLDSLRYQTFVKSGIKCVVCGLTASFFAVERHHTTKEDVYHLNLYGVKRRKEILFTKDHIIPRSRGGKDLLQNFQTMCAPCNDLKGNYQGTDGIQTTCTADPKKVQQKRANRLANLLARVEKNLAQLRQDGKKLFVEGSLDGGPEFLAYHLKNDLKKKVLRQRHKNLVTRFLQQKTERAEARERRKVEANKGQQNRIAPDFVITSLGGPDEPGDAAIEDDSRMKALLERPWNFDDHYYVREGLVYDRKTDKAVGFTDAGIGVLPGEIGPPGPSEVRGDPVSDDKSSNNEY